MQHQVIADLLVTGKEEMNLEINRAVEAATGMAQIERHRGVLVTRHDFYRFTVALDSSVPFGLISESDQVDEDRARP